MTDQPINPSDLLAQLCALAQDYSRHDVSNMTDIWALREAVLALDNLAGLRQVVVELRDLFIEHPSLEVFEFSVSKELEGNDEGEYAARYCDTIKNAVSNDDDVVQALNDSNLIDIDTSFFEGLFVNDDDYVDIEVTRFDVNAAGNNLDLLIQQWWPQSWAHCARVLNLPDGLVPRHKSAVKPD